MKTRPPTAWQRSAQFRAIGSAAIRAWNAKRHLLPKCGAARKAGKGPCRNLAMENGRCRLHGGRTPRKNQWHVTQRADDADKANRKIRDGIRAAKRRAKRLAAMAPEERAAYEKWQREHRPGSPAKRAAYRARRQQDRELAAWVEKAQTKRPTPESPEAAALREEHERLSRRLAEIENSKLGVFG